MTTVAAWKVSGSGPGAALSRLTPKSLELEQHLEEWIVSDPSLLDDGLVVVGRQLRVAGGPLDLLCLDLEGGLVLVELKKGGLYRETLAQALDYAASLSRLPADELTQRIEDYLTRHPNPAASERLREQARLDLEPGERRDVTVLIAGTRRDPGFDRLAEFLAEGWGVPIRVVTFQVLELGEGEMALIREAQETETPTAPRDSKAYTWETVLANAERAGVAPLVTTFRDAGIRNGLHARAWKVTLTLCPQENKTYSLFAVWPKEGQQGIVRVQLVSKTIAAHYPVDEVEVLQHFGGDDFTFDQAGLTAFTTKMDAFFESMSTKASA